MAIPATAVASHMNNYRDQPVEHDGEGSIFEPDGFTTTVLGAGFGAIGGRVIDAGGFNTDDGGDLLPGTADDHTFADFPTPAATNGARLNDNIAPGCTVPTSGGGWARETDGRCGLYTVGVNNANGATRGGQVPGAIQGNCGPQTGNFGSSTCLAPGAYTSNAGERLRFFDGKGIVTPTHGASAGINRYNDVNHKFREAARITSQPLPFQQTAVPPGDMAFIVFWGEWQDLNGNGVMDHACPSTWLIIPGAPTPDDDLFCNGRQHSGPAATRVMNEFTYLGGCMDFGGVRNGESINPLSGGSATANPVCREDPNEFAGGTACGTNPLIRSNCAQAGITLYLWPGNRMTGSPLTAATPGFAPGYAPATWALRELDCKTPPTCDEVAKNNFNGDPLFDDQFEVTPDDVLHDRLSDQDGVRQWVGGGGNGWSIQDDGVLINSIHVYAANCDKPTTLAGSTRFDLASCPWLDADFVPAVDPGTSATLTAKKIQFRYGGLVGPDPGWVTVRDGKGFEVGRLEDSLGDSRLRRETADLATGVQDDVAFNPGWSREPNVASVHVDLDADGLVDAGELMSDDYVGVAHGGACAGSYLTATERQHRGYCNTAVADLGYTGAGVAYSSYGGAVGRGFNDNQAIRDLPVLIPVGDSQGCLQCLYGQGFVSTGFRADNTGSLAADEHSMSLGPGGYFFAGAAGRWHDISHSLDETRFILDDNDSDPTNPTVPTIVVYGPDGWIGWLARENGFYKYRGYLDNSVPGCATERGSTGLTYAECNPYNYGNNDNPQEYAIEEPGEWSGACGASPGPVYLAPADGVLDTQLLVWPGYGNGINVDNLGGDIYPESHGPGAIVDPQSAFPGALAIDSTCDVLDVEGGGWGSTDHIFFVQGNLNDVIVTWQTSSIAIGADVSIPPDGIADSDGITDVDVYVAWA